MEAYPVWPEKIKILLNTGKKIDFSYDSGYDVTKVSVPSGAPYQAQHGAVAWQALECLMELEGTAEPVQCPVEDGQKGCLTETEGIAREAAL